MDGTTCYIYDAANDRVGKFDCKGVSTADYLYDINHRLMTEINLSDWKLQRANIYAGAEYMAEDAPDAYATGTPTASLLRVTDQVGTLRSRWDLGSSLDGACNSFPYGDDFSCSVSDPSSTLFTGKERDTESGLDYFGARYYSSNMGRFLSPDPAWLFAADPGNPQTWNQYAYVLNNPLSNTDPTGYDCVYLNNAGTGAESVDTNSNSGECGNNGGYWVDGTFTSGTVYSNSNDVYLHGTEDGQLTDAYYNSVTANGSNSSPSTVLSTPNIFPFNPQKPIPAQFLSSLVSSLNRSGQSDALINCIISHESGGNTTAATPPPNTAKGLMQVNNGGAADVARLDARGMRNGGASGFGGANGGQIASQLFDPAVNIAAGTALLNAKVNLYNGGDLEAGLAAYGTGDAYAKARMACAAGH